MSTEKGSFSADIGQEVIEAAMRSVDRASGENVTVEPTPEAAPATAAPSVPEQTADQKEIESLKAQLEFSTAKGRELMEKIKDAHERMLRAVADLDNFKKRAAKEKDEVQKFGTEKLLKDFLPVAENLDRALDHAKNAIDLDGFKKGVEMVRKQLDDTLGKHGVKAFSALGQPFDPRLHEAIQQQESAEVAPNTVVNELVRGYTLHERLVRPALVVVAKAPAAPVAAAGGGGEGEVKA